MRRVGVQLCVVSARLNFGLSRRLLVLHATIHNTGWWFWRLETLNKSARVPGSSPSVLFLVSSVPKLVAKLGEAFDQIKYPSTKPRSFEKTRNGSRQIIVSLVVPHMN